jgi:hypothetical protein
VCEGQPSARRGGQVGVAIGASMFDDSHAVRTSRQHNAVLFGAAEDCLQQVANHFQNTAAIARDGKACAAAGRLRASSQFSVLSYVFSRGAHEVPGGRPRLLLQRLCLAPRSSSLHPAGLLNGRDKVPARKRTRQAGARQARARRWRGSATKRGCIHGEWISIAPSRRWTTPRVLNHDY